MRKRIKVSLTLLCTLLAASLWCLAAPSDKYLPVTDLGDLGQASFHIFSIKDGLPQNTVQAMAVDQKNYLWVGTQDGAAFYNGRKWTVVNMPIKTVANEIRSMLVTADGSILFGTIAGGLVKLKENRWTVYDTGSGLPDNWVRSMIETISPNGTQTLWVGTAKGLVRFENGNWKTFSIDSGLPDERVKCLLETTSPNGGTTLWVGTQNGLASFERGSWKVFNTESGLADNDVGALLERTLPDGKRELLAGTATGLSKFEQGKWVPFGSPQGYKIENVMNLLETTSPDGRHTLWMGTTNGLLKYRDGRWTIIDNKTGLPNSWIRSLMKMNSQKGKETVWVGTNGGGLARIEENRWVIFNKSSGIPEGSIWCMLDTTTGESPAFWIGTDGNGLLRWEDGKWKSYQNLPNNVARSMLETVSPDGDRVLWVGTFGGLAKLEKGRWTLYDTKSGLPDIGVISLLETVSKDGTHTIWAGTFGGLAKFEKGEWTSYNTSSGLPNNRVWSLLETKSPGGVHTLWAGTNGGLARLEDGKWTTYDRKNGLPNDQIISLQETVSTDGKRTLWAGTHGGVARLDLSSKDAKWITLSDSTQPALPNNTVYQIQEDAKKRIYLFTIKGIARLTPRSPTPEDPSDYSIYTFTTEDGLPSNECNHGASMIDKKGRIWAGTIEGLAMFDPAAEVEDNTKKPLFIEKTLLGNKDYEGENGSTLDRASLAYNQNSLSFEYSLLSYFKESETLYRTQLEGLDKEPSEWTANNKRDYTTLPDGFYTFKVWGRDYAGNITGPVTLAFTIRPAPWKTWWAYLLYLGGAAGLGYGGIRLRLQALERHNRQLEEKIEERTAELEKKNEELGKKNEELVRSRDELVQSYKKADQIFSALSDALPGTVLDEKYQIETKIGAGGFGTVYRATHLTLNRPVAIKIFRPAAGNATVESLERFRLEGISTCRVNHPNAISVLDFNITSTGIAYLVMELLEGRTLSSELKEMRRLSPARCAKILLPVCDALNKAHAAGIVHRDIKPDNIFLHQTREGEVVKVVDFGIAKLLGETSSLGMDSLTATGGLLGTPAYMSPERLANDPYDGRSDVYSLGILLYQMLSGSVPHKSSDGSFWSIVVQHLKERPQPLRNIVPTIPEEVETAVMHALEKDPKKRPTARELAKEFAMAVGIELSVLSSGNFKFKLEDQLTSSGEVSTVDLGAHETASVPVISNEETIDDKNPLTGQITVIIPKK